MTLLTHLETLHRDTGRGAGEGTEGGGVGEGWCFWALIACAEEEKKARKKAMVLLVV